MNSFYSIPMAIMLSAWSWTASASLQTFYSLETALKQPTEVRILCVRDQGLKALPSSAEEMKNIEELDLSDNQLTEIPEAVYKMPNLRKLILTGNQIKSIPDRISLLTNLEELRISQSYTSMAGTEMNLPNELFKLPNLRILDAYYCGVAEIPTAISGSHLQELYLGHNKITSIPKEIFASKELKILDLSNNFIGALPEKIHKCQTLEVLRLYGNKITEIPESMVNLTNLQELNVGANALYKPVIDVKKIIPLTHLAIVNLSSLKLDNLPIDVIYWAAISELDLSGNNFTVLPDYIGKIPNLTKLNLSNNRLSALPQAFSGLSRLDNLNLSHNRFVAIPSQISTIHSLQFLNLSDNADLNDYSEKIKALSSIRIVNLRNTGLNDFQLRHINELLLTCSLIY